MARAPPPQEGVRSLLAKAKNRLSELDIQQRRGMNDPQRAIVDAPPGPRREALRNGGVDEVMRRVAIQAYLWQVSACILHLCRRHRQGGRETQTPEGQRHVSRVRCWSLTGTSCAVLGRYYPSPDDR